jgi:hypothetical protein
MAAERNMISVEVSVAEYVLLFWLQMMPRRAVGVSPLNAKTRVSDIDDA